VIGYRAIPTLHGSYRDVYGYLQLFNLLPLSIWYKLYNHGWQGNEWRRRERQCLFKHG